MKRSFGGLLGGAYMPASGLSRAPRFLAEKDEVRAKSGDFRRFHNFLAQKCDK